MPIRFTGRVSSRSSVATNGPPGEKAILELNPQRRVRILTLTGWPSLEPGTLNLEVDAGVLDLLQQAQTSLLEDARTIVYPDPWKSIPTRRKAYLYYKATASTSAASAAVLVRRAEIPVQGRVELFAAQNLRTALALRDGDLLEVELT